MSAPRDEPAGRFWSLDGGPHAPERARERAAGGEVWQMRGRRCATVPGMFAEFARQLRFGDHFGHNWPALEEFLADLSWLPTPSGVLLVDGAETLLVDERPADLARLVDLLDRVGAVRAAEQVEQVGFQAVLATSTEGRRRALAARVRVAQASVRT